MSAVKKEKRNKKMDLKSVNETFNLNVEVTEDKETGKFEVSTSVSDKDGINFSCELGFYGLPDDVAFDLREEMDKAGILISEATLPFKEVLKVWQSQIKALEKFNKRQLKKIF